MTAEEVHGFTDDELVAAVAENQRYSHGPNCHDCWDSFVKLHNELQARGLA